MLSIVKFSHLPFIPPNHNLDIYICFEMVTNALFVSSLCDTQIQLFVTMLLEFKVAYYSLFASSLVVLRGHDCLLQNHKNLVVIVQLKYVLLIGKHYGLQKNKFVDWN